LPWNLEADVYVPVVNKEEGKRREVGMDVITSKNKQELYGYYNCGCPCDTPEK
jgi:hypothetical protein